MRLERTVSVVSILLLTVGTLGSEGLRRTGWGVVAISTATGAELIGGADCANINATYDQPCPMIDPAGAKCPGTYVQCKAGATKQTKTDDCKRRNNTEDCQGNGSNCGAAYDMDVDGATGCADAKIPE
jgi:hypothetical protein